MFQSYKKKNSAFCCNCDNYGHEYKNCPKPITSWGIILVKINSDNKIVHNTETININKHGFSIRPKNYKDLEIISKHMNTLEFLLIRRKYSLGYIEFMRGRYKPDNVDGINSLFQQMVEDEIKKIKNENFDVLWKELWNNNEKKIEFLKKEFEYSKQKYLQLKNQIDVDLPLDFYVNNVSPTYKTREWGFPKGRKNKGETDKECALREFSEETHISLDNISLINEIEPIEEKLLGTNGVEYLHIYYVAELKELKEVKDLSLIFKEKELTSNSEIGAVGFYNYNDAISMIRDYHVDKKNILTSIYMYYLEILLDNENYSI